MKKVALMIAASAAITNFLFALDVSYETGMDQSIKKDRSMSVKKGSEQKLSNRNFDTHTDVKSYSADIIFDPTPLYVMRANQCVKTIAVAADFGLSAVIDDEDGIIDLNRKNYIDSAAGSSMAISKISGVKEKEIKNYIACILGETARMAQANLDLQKKFANKTFSSRQIARSAVDTFDNIDSLTDQSIRLQYMQAMKSLEQPCRFLANQARDSIQCGTLTFSFVDNSIRQAGTLLSVSQNLYGINTSLRVSMSDTTTDGKEVARENSQSSSRDASLTQTGSNSMNRASKKTTNVSPFLPK